MLRYFFGKIFRNFVILFLSVFKYKDSLIYSYVPLTIYLEPSLIIEEDVYFSNEIKFIGRGTFIGSGTIVSKCEKIGKFCSISKDVKIGLINHPLNLPFTSPKFYNRKYNLIKHDLYNKDLVSPVEIENNVLISSNVVIIEGVKIGEGSVIGANSVVNNDVEPYSIVAGNPAKLVRYRFSKKRIKELLKIDYNNTNEIIETQISNFDNK